MGIKWIGLVWNVGLQRANIILVFPSSISRKRIIFNKTYLIPITSPSVKRCRDFNLQTLPLRRRVKRLRTSSTISNYKVLKQPRAKERRDRKNLARSTAFTIFREILVPSLFPMSRRITVNLAIFGKFRWEDGGGREHPSLLAAGDFRLSLPGKSGDGLCPASRDPEPTWFPR